MTGEFQGRAAVRRQLAAVRSKWLICVAGTGGALVVIGVVALLSLGMVVDWLAELPWLGRAALLLVNLGLISYISWRQVVEPVRNAPDEAGCALLVEQALPEFRTRLIASVQLTKPGAIPATTSTAMVQVLVQQTSVLAAPVDFRSVISLRQFWLCGLIAGLIVGMAGIALRLGAPASSALLQRAFLWHVPVPHKTHSLVRTGNLKIAQGDRVVIVAQATGRVPAQGRLLLRSASGATQEFTLLPAAEDRSRFAQAIDNVQESFTYRVRLNDDTSETWTVEVRERPVVTGLECQQIFPAYTQLAARRRAPTDLTLLAGSQLQLTGHANKSIAAATVQLAGLNTNFPARVNPRDPQRFDCEIRIPQAGLTGFTVQLRDTDGLNSKDMPVYRIEILPDQPPTVALTFPERKEELVTSQATVGLGIEAHDDFGIAKLTLHYRSPALHGGQEQIVDLDLAGATPRALHHRHNWQLAKLADFLPLETAIEYWLEVQDTNDVTGPGRGTTEHYWLKVVSTDDKRTNLMNRLDDYLGSLKHVAEEEEHLNQELGTLIYGKKKSE